MSSPAADDTSRKDLRVLLVEDVDFNLAILSAVLAERGWQPVAATSGEAALEILAEDADFQIILMDIGLPGIDGVETTRRIKENQATRAIPVIALTAESATEREHLLTAGLDGYAEKNFDPEQLFAAIARQLSAACENRQKPEPAAAPPAPQTPPDLDFQALFATYVHEQTIRRMAEAFFADTTKQLNLLGEAMASGDQAGVMACCHSLKGSSAIFTAKNLAAAVKRLEAAIRQGQSAEAESAWPRVLAAHESLRQVAASRFNLTGQNAAPPTGPRASS